VARCRQDQIKQRLLFAGTVRGVVGTGFNAGGMALGVGVVLQAEEAQAATTTPADAHKQQPSPCPSVRLPNKCACRRQALSCSDECTLQANAASQEARVPARGGIAHEDSTCDGVRRRRTCEVEIGRMDLSAIRRQRVSELGAANAKQSTGHVLGQGLGEVDIDPCWTRHRCRVVSSRLLRSEEAFHLVGCPWGFLMGRRLPAVEQQQRAGEISDLWSSGADSPSQKWSGGSCRINAARLQPRGLLSSRKRLDAAGDRR
jgi:hypothetical protein